MVVYQALYGEYRVYVRPYEMFVSEVDHEKYPQVTQRYRFELVEPSDGQEENCSPKVPESEYEEADIGGTAADRPVREKDTQISVSEKKDDGTVNPLLLEFLDAETLEDKMHIMIFGRNQMDDNLLNSIAISLDLVVEEKSTEEKFDEILNCLSMMERFECNRLR